MSPRLTWRAWRPGDDQRFRPREDFRRELEAEALLPEGPRWTALRDGRPIGFGGLERLEGRHRGGSRWGLWCVAAGLEDGVDARAWAFARACARVVVNRAERERGARWIQAAAPAHLPGAQALLRRLDFEPREEVEGPCGGLFILMVRES